MMFVLVWEKILTVQKQVNVLSKVQRTISVCSRLGSKVIRLMF